MLQSETTYLKTLVLSGTNVGDEGVAEIAKGLNGNNQLTALDLHRCQITDEGAIALAKALSGAYGANWF
jgi:Ran GTPase-activating protein (RanGAP) involved in mRNA processing and transport